MVFGLYKGDRIGVWHGLIYNLIDHHIKWTIGFQNYKQRDILQNYLIAQKKDDGGLILVVEVKKNVQYSGLMQENFGR